MAPGIQGTITDGRVEISVAGVRGNPQTAARKPATSLRFGRNPSPPQEIQVGRQRRQGDDG